MEDEPMKNGPFFSLYKEQMDYFECSTFATKGLTRYKEKDFTNNIFLNYSVNKGIMS